MRPTAFLLGLAACQPCEFNAISAEANLDYGGEAIVVSGRLLERNELDRFEFFEDVVNDIEAAEAGLFPVDLQLLGARSYGLGLRIRTPRQEGEVLTWNPALPDEEREIEISGSERIGVDDIQREFKSGSITIASASPLVLSVDLVFSPTPTSTAVDDVGVTGEIAFQRIGNSTVCE